MEKKKQTFRDNYYYNLVRKNMVIYERLFNLTHEKLAEILDFTTNYIAKVGGENVDINPSLSLIIQLSILFDIPLYYFCLKNPEMPKKIIVIDENVISNFKHITIDYNHYFDIIRKNIKNYKTLNGKSSKELSLEIDRDKVYISKILNLKKRQNFTIATIGRIADALDVPIEKFFEE